MDARRNPSPTKPDGSEGDALRPSFEVIEVQAASVSQLFNAIDPSPFRTRDLRADVEDFIVAWAREVPRDASLALRVHLPGKPEAGEIEELREAVHGYFRSRAHAARRRLRLLFRIGRTSLIIGLLCLASAIILGNLIGRWLQGFSPGSLLQESVMIGGWVAMWRPLETFLYDWWPIRAEQRLFQRLAGMPVRIQYAGEGTGGISSGSGMNRSPA